MRRWSTSNGRDVRRRRRGPSRSPLAQTQTVDTHSSRSTRSRSCSLEQYSPSCRSCVTRARRPTPLGSSLDASIVELTVPGRVSYPNWQARFGRIFDRAARSLTAISVLPSPASCFLGARLAAPVAPRLESAALRTGALSKAILQTLRDGMECALVSYHNHRFLAASLAHLGPLSPAILRGPSSLLGCLTGGSDPSPIRRRQPCRSLKGSFPSSPDLASPWIHRALLASLPLRQSIQALAGVSLYRTSSGT